MTLRGAAIVLLWSASSAAVPSRISIRGLLLDATGGPVEGEYALHFALHATEEGTTPLWQEADGAVLVIDGGFERVLGDDPANPVLPAVAGGSGLWLAVTVLSGPGVPADAVVPLPRRDLASAAYAMHAAVADVASGLDCLGCVGPASIAPASIALGDLALGGCAPGEILGRGPGGFGCLPDHDTIGETGLGAGLSPGLLALDPAATAATAALATFGDDDDLAAALPAWDHEASDDLTVTTPLGGALTGTAGTVSLAPGAVTLAALAPGLLAAGALSSSGGTTQAALDGLSADAAALLATFRTGWSASAPGIGQPTPALDTWVPAGRSARILKTKDASLLRVTWSDNLRVGYACTTTASATTEVRLDGGKMAPRCRQTTTLAVNVGAAVVGTNHHAVDATVCLVEGVPSGPHDLELWVQSSLCGQSYVGWASTQALLLVEELDPALALTYTRAGGQEADYAGDWAQVGGRTAVVTKAAAASRLLITYADTLRVSGGCNGGQGKVEVRMDGAALPQPCLLTKYDGTSVATALASSQPFVMTCAADGVGAGEHTFTVWQKQEICGKVTLGAARSYPLLLVEEVSATDPRRTVSTAGAPTGELTGGWSQAAGRQLTHTVTAAGQALELTLSDTWRTSYGCQGGYGYVELRMDGKSLDPQCLAGAYHYTIVTGATENHEWPLHLVCLVRNPTPGPHLVEVWWKAETCGSVSFGYGRGQSLLMAREL